MSSRSYCARAVPVLAALLLAACGDDPQVPSASAPVSNATFVGRVSVVLQQAPSVRITDQKGKNIKGLLVRWRVTSGGGRVSSDTVRTDVNGVASSGGWVLGTTSGTQTLEAAVDGLSPTVFTATATPGPLAQVTLTSANNQVAEVNTDVPVPPAVRAADQYGNPIAGLPTTFAVTQGTGSVTGANQVTNAQGIATVTGWRLGTVAGTQRVRAVVIDEGVGTSASADVSAVAQPAAAFNLIKLTGDNQVGNFGNAAPVPPGVRIVDVWGNGVGNIPVTFTPGVGSGTVSSGQVSSDPANGSAFVGAWNLGPTETTQTLVATSSALPGKSATFTASVGSSQFDIDVRFIGTVTNPAVRQAFLTAAAKWKTVIVGDLQRTIVNNVAGACDSWIPAINETINDVVIFARVAAIDGAGDSTGNILGQAGPCAVNPGTRLTSYGLMEFDEFDLNQLVADGSLVDVIIHEMGHVLGIGTLWNFGGRSLLVGAGTNEPYFQGSAARTQFTALNNATYSGIPVPVENSGGGGTRDSHWREGVLRNELMTGFLNFGSNPLSRISVGSLQDLGYTVNVAAADGYSFTASLYRFPVSGVFSRRMHADVKTLPLFTTDAQGRPIRVR
ncbi:leishmanolysin-related zinc metalloendopeptidase [Gemmatimonas sp.]